MVLAGIRRSVPVFAASSLWPCGELLNRRTCQARATEAQYGVPSRFGSLRTLAALRHQRKQAPATLRALHIQWGNCAATALGKINSLPVLGVRKNPFIEGT